MLENAFRFFQITPNLKSESRINLKRQRMRCLADARQDRYYGFPIDTFGNDGEDVFRIKCGMTKRECGMKEMRMTRR